MLATVAKSAKKYNRQVQCGDQWVIQLGDAAMQDQDYLAMVHNIENEVTAKELHENSELKLCEGILGDLSTFTLKMGQTLILREIKRYLSRLLKGTAYWKLHMGHIWHTTQ